MSNTELLSKRVVLSENQFEKDGFTFRDSTEHLMPLYLNHIWKQVSVSCFSPKIQTLSDNVNRSQNQIEKVILHIRHLTKLTLKKNWR